jgi:hypothetical protein
MERLSREHEDVAAKSASSSRGEEEVAGFLRSGYADSEPEDIRKHSRQPKSTGGSDEHGVTAGLIQPIEAPRLSAAEATKSSCQQHSVRMNRFGGSA